MSDVEIRPTVPADLDALADVLVQVHASDGYPVEGAGRPRAWVELSEPLGQWTAHLSGRPVGHVALLKPGPSDAAPTLLNSDPAKGGAPIGVLARLFVSPSARGQAIGRRLMEVVQERAESLGLRLVLDVMAKDESAIRLYESRGWRVLGDVKHAGVRGELHEARAMIAPPLNHEGQDHTSS